MIDLKTLPDGWHREPDLLLQALNHPDIRWNRSELARQTGVNPQTLRSAVSTAQVNGFLPSQPSDTVIGHTPTSGATDAAAAGRVADPAPVEAKPADLYAAERKIERTTRELSKTRKQLKEAAKQANLVDEVVDLVKPVLDLYATPRQTPYRFKAPKRKRAVSIVWELADIHWDEYVDPDHVGGVNAYSPEIAAKRFEVFTDRALAWVENMQILHGVDELVVFGMNDLVSNLNHLHPESSTDTAGGIIQTLDVSLVISQVLTELAPHVPLLRVEASAGSNHGRTTKKNQDSSTLLGTSLDTFAWQMVRALTVNQPNIRIVQHPGYKAFTTVQNQRCAFAHGHLMRGGGGSLGIPAYALKRMHDATVSRSLIETKQMFKDDDTAKGLASSIDALSRVVDHTRVAHFHTEGIWRMGMGTAGFVPSLMGPNAYAIDQLEKYSPAGQMLEVFHPERGIISRHTIDVQDVMEPDPARYAWGTSNGEMAVEVMQEWTLDHR